VLWSVVDVPGLHAHALRAPASGERERESVVEIDLEWVDLCAPESPLMETAVAGRVSRVRPPRPASESNRVSFSQDVTQSSSSGWLASSLIESSVWSSPPAPLMDLNTPVPRSRSIQVSYPSLSRLFNMHFYLVIWENSQPWILVSQWSAVNNH
jgi:hypothetical protein